MQLRHRFLGKLFTFLCLVLIWNTVVEAKKGLTIYQASIFADKKGLLINEIASRKVNDIVHINLSGIIKLGMLFRRFVLTITIKLVSKWMLLKFAD